MTGAAEASAVYEPSVPEGYEWVMPVGAEPMNSFIGLDGTPRAATWSPVPVELIDADEGRRFRRADLPWFGRQVLVLRDEAIEAVGPILEPHGELLPLSCPAARLALFNATRIVDALDEERSELVRSGTGQLLQIRRPAFHPGRLAGPLVFKVPQQVHGAIYLTGDVVQRIHATARWTGVTFRQVATAPAGQEEESVE